MTHPQDTLSEPVFVFGSNLAGRHGKGAALWARQHRGAIYGQGEGVQGNSYAIPTKDERLNALSLTTIQRKVWKFLDVALGRPDLSFQLTPIGCGLAGYTPEQIAPMFRDAPPNVILPEEFRAVLGNSDVVTRTATAREGPPDVSVEGPGMNPSYSPRGPRDMSPATITRYEAATYLGVSVDTLDRLRASGRITACQVSKRLVKYRQSDLDAYLTLCQSSPSSASQPRPTGTSSGTKVDVRAASQRAQQAVRKLRLSSLRSA